MAVGSTVADFTAVDSTAAADAGPVAADAGTVAVDVGPEAADAGLGMAVIGAAAVGTAAAADGDMVPGGAGALPQRAPLSALRLSALPLMVLATSSSRFGTAINTCGSPCTFAEAMPSRTLSC